MVGVFSLVLLVLNLGDGGSNHDDGGHLLLGHVEGLWNAVLVLMLSSPSRLLVSGTPALATLPV